jgi:hypothetical protein
VRGNEQSEAKIKKLNIKEDGKTESCFSKFLVLIDFFFVCFLVVRPE